MKAQPKNSALNKLGVKVSTYFFFFQGDTIEPITVTILNPMLKKKMELKKKSLQEVPRLVGV